MPLLGDMVRETVIDPVEVSGSVPAGQRRNWWPWIVAGLVVAGLVYVASQEDDEEGDDDRPFAEAG